MKKTKLIRRAVTNEEFNQALADDVNKKTIKRVLSKYYSLIPPEELQACGLDALWRCLGYHQEGRGNKFTSSLWRFTVWECRRALKRINTQRNKHTVNISAIETQNTFDIPAAEINPNVEYLRECMDKLRPDDRTLIKEYYLDKYTMEEIGNLHGYSKEAARQKINKALTELKKICLASV